MASGAVVVRQMKLGLVAIPGVTQPRYPGHLTFDTNIFGRWDKQYSECYRGGTGRGENARSIRAKLSKLSGIEFPHPRQKPRPLTTRRATPSRYARLFWIVELPDSFNVSRVEAERLKDGARRRRVRYCPIGQEQPIGPSSKILKRSQARVSQMHIGKAIIAFAPGLCGALYVSQY
jgi:hypothetical protein